MYDDRIYYADQSEWTPVDWQGLWRYFGRLFQYIAIKPQLAARPETLAYQIKARRVGTRGAELAALDLTRMSHETRYLMKHMLIHIDTYDIALERFPNLRGLDDEPRNVYPYYVEQGIYL